MLGAVSHPVFIVNPFAGGGRQLDRWLDVEERLAAKLSRYEVTETQGPGHATELARRALELGANPIVAAGGDGTVSEVARAFFDRGGARVGASALGILPLGSGNDLARTLGIGTLDAALAALERPPRPIDAIWAETAGHAARPLFNSASIGISTGAIVHARRISDLIPATLRYFAGAVWAALFARRSRIRATIDGEAEELRPLLLAVANGPSFGGGHRVAPRALVDDGWLDLVSLERSLQRAIGLIAALPAGRHLGLTGVRSCRAREIKLEALDGGALSVEGDGELLGELPASLRVMPAALEVHA